MSFTVVPEDPARQLADPGPPEACPYCGKRASWRNGCYERHRLPLDPCRVQRWRCQTCGRTHSPSPDGVTRQQRTWPWQEILMRLYWLGVSLRATSASPEVLGCFVSPTSLWRDVPRLQMEVQWGQSTRCGTFIRESVVAQLSNDGH
ncbi:MAG: IS1 family transposase [Caldilineaceae bacterium SB0665_bin_21]|nr:IS1 family transposase [Caldilineaceae bacterium SB0665_bin_21]MYA06127.1 IS1 family transposase [Caldilineaceae bacterium SB0664_bin_22]MYC62852.1 IS1 family transposase [Caldilineaceae bacterium SB0661_bin_34]